MYLNMPQEHDQELAHSHARVDDASGARQKLRRISQACATCARKKVKCDGRHPCAPCKDTGKECVYNEAKKRGPVKGFKKERIEEEPAEIKQRLRYLEDQIAHLKNDPSAGASNNPTAADIKPNILESSQSTSSSPPKSRLPNLSTSRGRSSHTSSDSSPKRRTRKLSPRSDTAYTLASMQPTPSHTNPSSPLPHQWIDRTPSQSSFPRMMPTFTSSTVPPTPLSAPPPAQQHQQQHYPSFDPNATEGATDSYHGPASGFPSLRYDSSRSDKYPSVWQLSPTNVDVGVPDYITARLVEFVHQVWPILARPTVSIQAIMQTYPKALLFAMCSLANFIGQVDYDYYEGDSPHSLRLTPDEVGSRYQRGAKKILWDNDFRSDIPSIQALLLLALRENGMGRAAKGWQFVGIAQRMVVDLAIHRGEKFHREINPRLSSNEIEERRRIFWGCYIISQMTTASLGRPVVFRISDCDVTLPSTDGPEENELWDGGPTLRDKQRAELRKQPCKSLSTFRALAQLAQILEGIISEIYSMNRSTTNEGNTVKKFQSGIQKWFSELPNYLVCDPRTLQLRLPQHCLCMAWGLACQILLYRPFVPKTFVNTDGIDNPHYRCTEAANAMCEVTEVYSTNFDLRRVAGSFVFSLFTGATIHAANTALPDSVSSHHAHTNLKKCFNWLDHMAKSWSAASQHKNMLLALLNNSYLVPSQPDSISSRRNSENSENIEHDTSININTNNNAPSNNPANSDSTLDERRRSRDIDLPPPPLPHPPRNSIPRNNHHIIHQLPPPQQQHQQHQLSVHHHHSHPQHHHLSTPHSVGRNSVTFTTSTARGTTEHMPSTNTSNSSPEQHQSSVSPARGPPMALPPPPHAAAVQTVAPPLTDPSDHHPPLTPQHNRQNVPIVPAPLPPHVNPMIGGNAANGGAGYPRVAAPSSEQFLAPILSDEQAQFWTNMPLASEDSWTWFSFTNTLPPVDGSSNEGPHGAPHGAPPPGTTIPNSSTSGGTTATSTGGGGGGPPPGTGVETTRSWNGSVHVP